MTKLELINWLNTAVRVDTIYRLGDEEEQTRIYKYESKLYAVPFSGGYFDNRDYSQKDFYFPPTEVVKKERQVTETYYETPDGKEEFS
jgi:hypothetical protein